jgi:hypothetical protein
MTDPRTPPSGKVPGRARVPTEALLSAVRDAAERLTRFSRDPDVRREAAQVAQAVGRLLEAIRRAAERPK